MEFGDKFYTNSDGIIFMVSESKVYGFNPFGKRQLMKLKTLKD